MFEKGKSGNPNGRKKGVSNKAKREIRELFNSILSNEMESVTDALDYLREYNPEKYLTNLMKITELLYGNLHEEPTKENEVTIIWGTINNQSE